MQAHDLTLRQRQHVVGVADAGLLALEADIGDLEQAVVAAARAARPTSAAREGIPPGGGPSLVG